MSRVTYSKGVDLIIRLAEKIEVSGLGIIIDFYGPIANDEKELILEDISRFNFLSYKGIVQPHEVYTVLSKYDVLLLPTSYKGEGFPGAIMDAYIAGIPVIASKWKQIPEFVEHGKSGLLFPLDKEKEFFESVFKLYHDETLLENYKRSAHLKSKQYSPESAWRILQSVM